MPKFHINPRIESAETLPADFYKDESVFEESRDKIFAKSWQFVGDSGMVTFDGQVHPMNFLDYMLEEPMLLSKEGENIYCLSNVCTHRGNILCHHPGQHKKIMCAYHGRRFNLNGQFDHMPQFKEAEGFPRKQDHLHQFPLKQWGPWLFASIEDGLDFDQVIHEMDKKVGFMPLDQFKRDNGRSKDYLVEANWALYCDNYLEGFHIPFVHAGLNDVLDYGSYETVLHKHLNLQVGYSSGGDHVFDFPEGHEDYGKSIAAYYFWLFPNMMFNFYPWGLSINIVKPISVNRCKVSFISYVLDPDKLDQGAGAALDKVEREDEFVVEGVQKGIQSRVYQTGRFSPTMEKGVHHFHSLLAEFLNA